tara:strand:+ start:6834 stop:7049 length:216 start_codon:yes stop_codon:yes gene_type:complete
MTDNLRAYDRQWWVKTATEWLHGSTADGSMLYSASIALKRDEPELSAKCLEESRRRRAQALARSRKQGYSL